MCVLQAVPPQHHQPQLRVVVDITVETQLLPARQVPLFVSFFSPSFNPLHLR